MKLNNNAHSTSSNLTMAAKRWSPWILPKFAIPAAGNDVQLPRLHGGRGKGAGGRSTRTFYSELSITLAFSKEFVMQFDLWYRHRGWLSLAAIILTAGALV